MLCEVIPVFGPPLGLERPPAQTPVKSISPFARSAPPLGRKLSGLGVPVILCIMVSLLFLDRELLKVKGMSESV